MTIRITGPQPGDSLAVIVTAENGTQDAFVPNTLLRPSAPGAGTWTVQATGPDSLRITLSSPPADADLFEVEHVSTGNPLRVARSDGTATLDLTGLLAETYTLRLRGIGLRSGGREVEGLWSPPRTATPASIEEPEEPPPALAAFTDNQWSVDATGVSGEVEITLTDVPAGAADALVYVDDGLDIALVHTFVAAAANDSHVLTGLADGEDVSVTIIARAANGALSAESEPKTIAPFVGAPPEGNLWSDDRWLLVDMRDGTLALHILEKTPGQTPNLAYQVNGGEWITHPSKANKLGWYVLTGTTVGQSANVRARLLRPNGDTASETNIKTQTPTVQDFPAMLAADWALAPEPCTSGDLLRITPLVYEDYLGYTRNGFDIEVTDTNGTRVERLRMGAYTDVKRRYRVLTGQATSIRMRRVYTNNVDDEVKVSPWSPLKSASPTTGAISFSITSNFTTGIAPANIMFEVELEGTSLIEPLLDADFAWVFDDPGTHTRMDADHPWARDRNIAYGNAVGHIFPDPGSYTVTCMAYVEGEVRVATQAVSITAFSGTTVTIGTSGDHATLAAAIAAHPSGNLRCLFQRGQTHQLRYLAGRSGVLQFGAVGFGSDPEIVPLPAEPERTIFDVTNQSGPIAFFGLHIKGPHDPSDPFNTVRGGIGIDVGGSKPPMMTVYDCRLSGNSVALYQGGGVGDLRNVGIANTVVYDWFNFGFAYPESGWITIEGCMFRQSPLVYNDPGRGETVPPFVADHGPHRVSRPTGPHSIQNSWFTSYGGWSGDDSAQPTLRWNTGGAEFDTPNKFNLDRFMSEGGGISSGPGTTGARVYFHWVVMDKVVSVRSHQPSNLFSAAYPGQRVRNFVLIQPAASGESSTGMRAAIGASNELSSGGALVSEDDCQIYNGTVIDLRNDTQSLQNATGLRPFVLIDGNVPNLVQIGNLVAHVPNGLTGGTTADEPLDMSPGAALFYPGRRITYETNVPLSGGVSRPTAGGNNTDPDIVTGATSGASGIFTKSFVSSGRFGTNDAAGFHTLANVTGTFEVGENLLVGGNVVAVVSDAPFQGSLTLTGHTGQTAALGRPLPGSPAIGSATGDLIAHRDFYGTVRGASPSRGAFEPAV